MLRTFLPQFIFPKEIVDLQELPRHTVLSGLAKNLNKINGLSEVPNTLQTAMVLVRHETRVKRGDFYIVTHSHVRKYVEERATEILAAFDKQAPYKEGDDRYEVDAIIARVMAARQEGKS